MVTKIWQFNSSKGANGDDGSDVRHKAAAILSGHKLRMLEEAGLTVVEKQWVRDMEFQVAYLEDQCKKWTDLYRKGLEMCGFVKMEAMER